LSVIGVVEILDAVIQLPSQEYQKRSKNQE
jgi:hypothetical protein